MFKKIAATALAASALVIGGATVSSATPSDNVCDIGEYCIYDGTNYGGAMRSFLTDFPNYAQVHFFWPDSQQSVSVNDRASSTRNNSAMLALRAYENANFGGDYREHRPAGTGCVALVCPSYSSLGSWDNNALTSHQWI
uniref:peptidase inhibitor family I36 protein n=1 Tax=Streptomyces sp. CA-141956 TaxID=3240051 RepID=UPI003F4968D3